MGSFSFLIMCVLDRLGYLVFTCLGVCSCERVMCVRVYLGRCNWVLIIQLLFNSMCSHLVLNRCHGSSVGAWTAVHPHAVGLERTRAP